MKRCCLILSLLFIIMSVSARGDREEERDHWRIEDFSTVVEAARGSTVTFYMWGGSATINAWIDGFVSQRVHELYGMKLRRVPMDAAVFVNKLLAERDAGLRQGRIDLVWINGENFMRAKKEGLLYGPFAERLPNFTYVDPDTVEFDFGFPVEGWEAPYGRAQFVFEYDSAIVSDPPDSLAKLKQWVRENPGMFTYPAPPDFTGSAFLRQVVYGTAGGYEEYTGDLSREEFIRKTGPTWEYLTSIRPFLWQQGRTYPTDKARLDILFERGEVLLNMTYTQADATGRIRDGRYPETVRTFVLQDGSLANTHFTAIPFNAPNVPGAMVLANFLLSPEAQLSKNRPEKWGDFTVLDYRRLPDAWRGKFDALDLGAATLSLEELSRKAVPEMSPEYLEWIEDVWHEELLR